MTHAAQHVRLPIRLNVHSFSFLESSTGSGLLEKDAGVAVLSVSWISSEGMKPHDLVEAVRAALKAWMRMYPSLSALLAIDSQGSAGLTRGARAMLTRKYRWIWMVAEAAD
jgi:hypothetical protein